MSPRPRSGIRRVFRTETPGLGDRVTVRRRVPGTRQVTDVIGHIVALEPLTVRPQEVGGLPSNAEAVVIDPAQLVTVRLLPERTVRNGDIRAVEVATARAFPGIEHATSSDGQWLLRAGDSVTERSNSAAPLGPQAGFGAVPLDEILAFYARHSMPAIIQVPERITRPAERLAAGPEWEWGPEILVMTRPLDDAAPAATVPDGFTFEVDDAPDEEWYSLYHFRGQALPRHALELLRGDIDGTMSFGRIRAADGRTAAITRGTVTADDAGRSWLGLSAVEVSPDFQRHGLGKAITAGMLAWGTAAGAGQAFLQVVHTNTAGIRLYRSAGFAEHHRHRYAHHLPSSG